MTRPQLHAFTARLAEALTGLGLAGVWKATALHDFCWVALADRPGVRLNLRLEPGRNGRLLVRPEYPRDGWGARHTGGGPEEAGYAARRSPDDVARDLVRRLLPPYLEALDVAGQEVARADKNAVLARALFQELAGMAQARTNPDVPLRFQVKAACGATVHAQVNADLTVSFTLVNLPADLARFFLRTLKNPRPGAVASPPAEV